MMIISLYFRLKIRVINPPASFSHGCQQCVTLTVGVFLICIAKISLD